MAKLLWRSFKLTDQSLIFRFVPNLNYFVSSPLISAWTNKRLSNFLIKNCFQTSTTATRAGLGMRERDSNIVGSDPSRKDIWQHIPVAFSLQVSWLVISCCRRQGSGAVVNIIYHCSGALVFMSMVFFLHSMAPARTSARFHTFSIVLVSFRLNGKWKYIKYTKLNN